MNVFSSISKDKFLENEPMSKHTSFQAGGPADVLFTPTEVAELLEVVDLCKQEDVPYYLIGRGSNVLFTDKGFRGVVIQTTALKTMFKEGELIYAAAGVNLASLSNFLLKEGLSGFEFASGIPGSVGGAIYMNAGAYGEEMREVITWVEVFRDGKIEKISAEDMKFGYRHSLAKEEQMVILGGYFTFVPKDPEEIREKILRLNGLRLSKQPLELPSAGSTFKRPPGHFAGKLIQDSELMGYRIGGAQVSTKHAGFIVNINRATATDIMALVAHVKQTVYDKYQVTLEEELVIVGER